MTQLLQDNTLDYPSDLDLYPESDGKPMAENTEQYRWIVMVKENLEIMFASEPEVFIAADLLWYPREASKPIPEDFTLRSQAPDVMVIFGRPKGKRGSYKQWEEAQISPQVVFEILSPSNKTKKGVREMQVKLGFYQTYGVEEYYVYDPETNKLQGWLRQSQSLKPIPSLLSWVSPRLGIRFENAGNSGEEMKIYRPDGRQFLSSVKLAELAEIERHRAEAEWHRAEAEWHRAEAEWHRADNERQQKEFAQQQEAIAREREAVAQEQADQAVTQVRQAVVRLQQAGMTIAQISQIMSLSVQQVEEIVSENS